jgi:hypothetical protein
LGATNPEIDSIYRWLISDWSLPFTSEKLSLAWLIRPIVDNEHTMRELIWLALLVGLLALLLLGKPWIARGLQTYLAVPDKTRAQPPEYIPAASPPALDAAPAAERAVGEES